MQAASSSSEVLVWLVAGDRRDDTQRRVPLRRIEA